VYPDVRVVERGHGPALAVAVQSDVAVEEPLVLRVASEPMTETFIQIIDVGSGKQVVTVLEVLSLANKAPGDSRNQYRQKRKELMAGGVSLVEIDLLRAGAWSMSLAQDFIPPTIVPPTGSLSAEDGVGILSRSIECPCASDCRSSGFPCARPTPTYRSICKP
jgi:hypothetical protein